MYVWFHLDRFDRDGRACNFYYIFLKYLLLFIFGNSQGRVFSVMYNHYLKGAYDIRYSVLDNFFGRLHGNLSKFCSEFGD